MSKCRNLHQPTTNWRVALSIIVWPYSVTALWDCWVGQKGEGLVRILFWFLFLTHTHTHPSLPEALTSQVSDRPVWFLSACKTPIVWNWNPSLQGCHHLWLWLISQADILFLHSPACTSPFLPQCHEDLAQGLSPTLGLWRRGCMGSL